MRRFLPYLKYLRGRGMALIAALLFGAISAMVYGLGLPVVLDGVFPHIFTEPPGIHATAAPPAHESKLKTIISTLKGERRDTTTPAERAAETERIKATRTLPTSIVIAYALLIPLIFFVRALAGFLNNYLMSYCGIGVLEALRVELYRKLQHLPLSYLGRNRTGDLLSRLTADTQVVQQTITSSASDLVIQPLTLASAVLFLAYKAWANHGVGLFLVSLAVVPACVFPIRFVGKRLLKRAEENQRLLGDISDLATQNLSAAREVRAFGIEERETSVFQETTRRLFRIQLKVVKYSQMLSPTIEFIASLGVALSLYYAYYSGLTLSVFLAIIGALFVCYEPMKKLGGLHSQLTRGAASLARIEEILNTPVTITDPAHPVAVGRMRGDLAFEHVTFAYNANESVLRDVSIQVPAGTICALVGPSGAGKSTFANLVPRFYDADTGAVTVDGHDVRSLRLADLRRNIAIVSQEPVLFNDTIYNNLILSRPDATRTEVEQAARNAFAHDFILRLEGGLGYDTVVGERGGRLSGGQKQRLALARAFLRNAPILILDEATSALDSESEAQIQAALKQLVVGKTVLIIAHRFSTIRDATKILVFDRGNLVATGTHADLYAKNDLYRTLYDRQQGSGAAPGGTDILPVSAVV
jgi:ATP-binding cassette, subfamily B, bacterial MsbA